MRPSDLSGSPEILVKVKDSTVHGGLLDRLASNVQVILNEEGENLVGDHLL